MADKTATRSPLSIFAIVAVAVVAIVALTLTMSGDDEVESATEQNAEATSGDQATPAPTGAGTNPDGVVDEATEGLTNETSADDLVDSSAASGPDGIDAVPADGVNPESSAEGLEPAVGEGNVEEMTPETQDN